MSNELSESFKAASNFELGHKLFLLGTFFLSSALPISIILYLLSSIISIFLNGFNLIKRDLNYTFLISFGIIIFATLNITLLNRPEIFENYDISFIWINLLNWLPILIFYSFLKFYLISFTDRIAFAKFLIYGTIPVIISMIIQKFFGVYGPFETLFGSIVWFQKPLLTDNLGVSGLFSNANYAGSWLILTLPFSFLLVNYNKKFSFKLPSFIILISIIYMILLTGSRNALLSLFIIFFLLIDIKKHFKKFIFLSTPFILLITFLRLNMQLEINKYLSIKVIDRLFNTVDYPRLGIWEFALNRIQERPLFGWGGSTFSLLHFENKNIIDQVNKFIHAQHTHNLALELAYNYGILLSIILCFTAILFLSKSIKLIYFSDIFSYERFENKVWLSSLIIFFVTHNFDITIYDGKISALVSLLFAGNFCIVNELEVKKSKNKYYG